MNGKIRIALVTGIMGLLMAFAAPFALAGNNKFSLYNKIDPGFNSSGFGPSPSQYSSGPWVFKLTSPSVSPGSNLPQTGRSGTESQGNAGMGNSLSGLDETEAAATYNLYAASSSTPGIDLTGKVKLNWGNSNKVFGFAQNDYAAQMDVYQSMDKFTAKGSLGSRVLGSPSGIVLNPVLYGSFGGIYQFTGQTSTGVDMNLSQDGSSTRLIQPELSAYVSYKLDKNFKARGYVLRGFSNGNLNSTVGGQVYYGF